MSCMCGDTRCKSCGPAQGNYQCIQCGKWDDEGGCVNPQECKRKNLEEFDKYEKENSGKG